jgi:hypothetical protein
VKPRTTVKLISYWYRKWFARKLAAVERRKGAGKPGTVQPKKGALRVQATFFSSSIGSATSFTPKELMTFRTVSNSGFAVSLKVL